MEAAISFTIFFIFVTGILELGLVSYRRSLLQRATAMAVGQAARTAIPRFNCDVEADISELNNKVTEIASGLINDKTIFGTAPITFKTELKGIKTPHAVVEVTGNWHTKCIFCWVNILNVPLNAAAAARFEQGCSTAAT